MYPFQKFEDFDNGKIQKTLYLTRHGETPTNAARILQGSGIDSDLSERGIGQAKKLRDRFEVSGVIFDLIVYSSMKRAKQTAEIIAEKQSAAKLLVGDEIKGLREIGWGNWEGQKGVDLKPLLDKWKIASAPNGESPKDCELRSVPIIYDLLINRPEKNILFVIHGRLLRLILGSILHRDLRRMNDYSHHNTSVNLLKVSIDKSNCLIKAEARELKVMEAIRQFRIKRTQWVKENGGFQVMQKSIDDNVEIEDTNIELNGFRIEERVSFVEHDDSVMFEPIILDDFDHLPKELQSFY
ncbi:hypothetical protein HK096_007176 [Nowakowskiella sp. JEL0078]|nr:hypothetical protein HK096_007176 [Nowakowskiella sp. JEL0078]